MNTGVLRRGRCLGFVLASLLSLGSAAALAGGRFAFISTSPETDPWWRTVKNGTVDAAEDFDVKVDYRNPKTGDMKELAALIDEVAAAKYDGIITVMPDFGPLKSHLDAVTKKYRIPLVTVNTGSYQQSESVGAILHVGQLDYDAGKQAGQKAGRTGIKSFVCFNHYANIAASHERCKGFAEGLGLAAATELSLTGDAKSMQGQVQSYLAEHKTIEAILTLGPPSAEATLAALKLAKLDKAPYFVSFDLSKQITQAIKKGQIAFALDQQPYLQGYLTVGVLAEWKKSGLNDLLMTKTILYSNKQVHARVSKYGLTLLTFGERHISSGPAFIERYNVGKVETFSGTYR